MWPINFVAEENMCLPSLHHFLAPLFFFFGYLIWKSISKSSAELYAPALPEDKPRALELSQSFSRNKLIKRIIKSLTH